MRSIAILGSTGSIGTQTLDVVRQHPDEFRVVVISANNNVDLLAAQAREFGVREAVICNESCLGDLRRSLSGSGVAVSGGIGALCDAVSAPDVDIVVAAMVGFSGLRPTVAAIKAGKDIAFANKETLVAAGSLVMGLVKEYGVRMLPVDSEHSAIFQCLEGAGGNPVRKIHLTASGGPFREWKREDIAHAGKDAALRHPNWSMGSKITIDSATMMNKGFEVIEARWLFGVPEEKIEVVVHPESVIHSMIEFEDGAVLAQLGCPDMREPIQYALSYPRRLSLNNRKLDFGALQALTFSRPDMDRFPCLGLAFEAIRRGGNIPCALNAANEVAVDAYLRDRIGFYDIAATAEFVMEGMFFVANPTLEDIFRTNLEAMEMARSKIW